MWPSIVKDSFTDDLQTIQEYLFLPPSASTGVAGVDDNCSVKRLIAALRVPNAEMVAQAASAIVSFGNVDAISVKAILDGNAELAALVIAIIGSHLRLRHKSERKKDLPVLATRPVIVSAGTRAIPLEQLQVRAGFESPSWIDAPSLSDDAFIGIFRATSREIGNHVGECIAVTCFKALAVLRDHAWQETASFIMWFVGTNTAGGDKVFDFGEAFHRVTCNDEHDAEKFGKGVVKACAASFGKVDLVCDGENSSRVRARDDKAKFFVYLCWSQALFYGGMDSLASAFDKMGFETKVALKTRVVYSPLQDSFRETYVPRQK